MVLCCMKVTVTLFACVYLLRPSVHWGVRIEGLSAHFYGYIFLRVISYFDGLMCSNVLCTGAHSHVMDSTASNFCNYAPKGRCWMELSSKEKIFERFVTFGHKNVIKSW